jgi:hypothetical protein
MAYIGRQNLGGAYRQLDDISSSFNGSTTAFTMQVNSTNVSLGDVNQIVLSLGGVIQKPGTDFTVSGSTLTFTTAPAANTSFFAILLGSDNGGTVTPTDASVTVSKLAIAGGEVKLDADGDTSITADTDDQIDFKTGGTDRMHIASDGDVLISKTSNAYQTTGHEFLDGGRAFHTADGGKALSLVRNSSNGAIMDFYNSGGSEVGSIETAASGIGIKLGGTASANLLDDYEEGTWTPTFSDGFYAMGSFSIQSGRYVKVGRQVFIQMYIATGASGWTSNGNQIVVTGLPFTTTNDSSIYNRGFGGFGYSTMKDSNGHIITNSDATSFKLYRDGYYSFTRGSNHTGGNNETLICGLVYETTA